MLLVHLGSYIIEWYWVFSSLQQVVFQALQQGSKHNHLSLLYLQKRKMHSGLQLVNSICGVVLQDMGIDDEDFLNIVKDIAAEEKRLLAHPLFQVCAMLLLLTIIFFNLRKS